MVDGNNAASLRTQTGLLRLTQAVAPILVLVGTIYVGARVDAFVGPADMPVTLPLSAAMIMGVFMFPGGAFFIARGLVYWSRARQARFWPAVKGHIAEEGRALPSILGAVLVCRQRHPLRQEIGSIRSHSDRRTSRFILIRKTRISELSLLATLRHG